VIKGFSLKIQGQLNDCPLKNILCCRAINDKGGIGEMLNMSQVNDIKDLAREGKRIGGISKKLRAYDYCRTSTAKRVESEPLARRFIMIPRNETCKQK
jgi:hypothetical protein